MLWGWSGIGRASRPLLGAQCRSFEVGRRLRTHSEGFSVWISQQAEEKTEGRQSPPRWVLPGLS